ncbi:hypothetical protein CC85DRAFT_246772 [Cutaneotrichosporon oleaginosum]|uniref:Small ribosomal subunit protein mS35 mitochondrial conserved domain-containing protein n=1 Tax=Cutaneotrichosporon oleaginosum TaxID=879819 RepID=A0A0J0XLD2_9TREE|nr:uncharacterized protein CC85DRAFT_246772 [Cutaneotrichosporon oleaginosum]KLT41892.1 hypothetical protein CC85DRAFT_246772 [Cutaneotrichosporon oleaginosum]TXT12493.1 hypothetical protein COLE_02903 [Cutaneotrichosporon oleaginosum]
MRNDTPTGRYMWDEASTIGYIRLAAIDDVRQLVANMYTDVEALNAQAKPFKPSPGKIRLTTAIDLANPNHEYNQKTVLRAPLSALPLKDAAAVRRFQLLAGPRWTPGEPGSSELVADGDGWFKISEARYPAIRMNRKSASDMLERLVAAANDPKSPIPADAPIDARHLLAKQRKFGGVKRYARREALQRRPEVVGGVKGFPKEWLSPEAQAKVKA